MEVDRAADQDAEGEHPVDDPGGTLAVGSAAGAIGDDLHPDGEASAANLADGVMASGYAANALQQIAADRRAMVPV